MKKNKYPNTIDTRPPECIPPNAFCRLLTIFPILSLLGLGTVVRVLSTASAAIAVVAVVIVVVLRCSIGPGPFAIRLVAIPPFEGFSICPFCPVAGVYGGGWGGDGHC